MGISFFVTIIFKDSNSEKDSQNCKWCFHRRCVCKVTADKEWWWNAAVVPICPPAKEHWGEEPYHDRDNSWTLHFWIYQFMSISIRVTKISLLHVFRAHQHLASCWMGDLGFELVCNLFQDGQSNYYFFNFVFLYVYTIKSIIRREKSTIAKYRFTCAFFYIIKFNEKIF